MAPDSSHWQLQTPCGLGGLEEARDPTTREGMWFASPLSPRATGERSPYDLVCLPPPRGPSVRRWRAKNVTQCLEGFEAPPNLEDHPVVKRHRGSPTPVLPVALYLDAVQYAVRDSMLVVSLTNLAHWEKTHLLACLRKRIRCGVKAGCGCKGWCSQYPLWAFLKWSFTALANATWPSMRDTMWEVGVDAGGQQAASARRYSPCHSQPLAPSSDATGAR